jgi:excisionase family DNA binding protein
MDGQVSHDRLLTVAEAASFAGVSTKTIYRAIDARRIKHARIGQSKCFRIRLQWVNDWIDASSVDVEPSFSEFDIRHPQTPQKTARRGPYAEGQTPRRGFLS